jgi:hypothetical protein
LTAPTAAEGCFGYGAHAHPHRVEEEKSLWREQMWENDNSNVEEKAHLMAEETNRW